ncbi:DUF1496 domain-containing protein [Photobacterium lutimaris]|uniref:DUF1496 domain-containing protein n=1 Tax=Photobacterium lutimaris TaxID=388278 RepID=A0A2T3J356_9GAMM|nr:DUF1496 domain-containing protein [Photobacterium lutimaris]PSU35737.1 DUF1496 domain-containing protein [Photobacterium lutimaris]TDR78802.1 uncharacterized protein DUF1496 [Photobacterium lutimaris]
MNKRDSVWHVYGKGTCSVQLFVFALSLLLALPLSLPVMAKEISVKSQPALSLEGTFNTQRVCFYQGQSYSLGAVIAIEGVLLECQPEKHFESNGALKWVKIEKKS